MWSKLKNKFFKKHSANDLKLAEDLKFLEDVLKEEDPEFMSSVASISSTDDDSDVSKPESVKTQKALKKPLLERLKYHYSALFEPKIIRSNILRLLLRPLMFHEYPKQAILFWILFGGLSYGFIKAYQNHYLKSQSDLFLTSYAKLGVQVHDYDMLDQVEPFFDNVRFSRKVMSIKKLTANIRSSENSSLNPMISLEVVIQGITNDPIVEIKDREAEFRDLILRVTEGFSYDELESSTGKQQLSEAILQKINANLTDGQVRKVFYKNFVIKP